MNIRRSLKRTVLFLIIFSLIIMPSTLAFGEENIQEQKELQLQEELNFLGNLLEFVKENYLYEVSEEQLIEGAMKGLFYYLDEYSCYYNKEEFQQLSESLSGDFVGIGIHIVEKDDYIAVITPIEGSPAFKAGIKPGDIIISVDDVNIKGYTAKQASDLIKGEINTEVKIGVKREGESETLYFNILRDEIVINPIEYKILEDNIGYIKITEFNDHTLENVLIALGEFNINEVDSIIFDVRNNPGGGLEEVVNVLRFLVPRGPIVHVKYSEDEIITHSSYNDYVNFKLAVLVNEGSASASEIFAGAIQDLEVGTIIGTNTFGKGTVQTVIPLINGGGIKLTIAEFFTANMNKVNKIGIKPDIIVENTGEEDLQLKEAIKVLKSNK